MESTINRFIEAQDSGGIYDAALEEIRSGRKRSHWIWFIFPQIAGLGHSAMAQHYGIASLEEAKAYWANCTLRERLKTITQALLSHKSEQAADILGSLDAMKVKSCMTLFDVVAPHDVFEEVLNTFYGGARCPTTLAALGLANEQKEAEREYRGIARPAYTPDRLTTLKADEVFVFGSNLHGAHAGGAARTAARLFGAIWGQGVGLQGQSYAIPTMQGPADTIRPYVEEFIAFAKEHEELFFYVTRIGCGIAGFRDADIAPLFAEALRAENICLPKGFVDVLEAEAGKG